MKILLLILTAPIRIPFWIARIILDAMFGKKELRLWKRAQKINVSPMSSQKQTIYYHGKKRKIYPIETFQKEGYSKEYLSAKVGLFGRKKTFNIDKIQ